MTERQGKAKRWYFQWPQFELILFGLLLLVCGIGGFVFSNLQGIAIRKARLDYEKREVPAQASK